MKKVFSFILFQNTLLHVACEIGNIELVKLLIDSNMVNIHSVNYKIFILIIQMEFLHYFLFIGQFYILHANQETRVFIYILKILE